MIPASTLRADGWLYLARPAMALGVVLFALVVWVVDRRQSRRARAEALEGTLSPARVEPQGPWWIEADGRRIPLAAALTLGRAPDCTVVLTDPAASSLHAMISVDPRGRPVLEDVGSRNGTLCEGARVTSPVPLEPGMVFQIGDAVIRVGRDPA